MMNVGDLLRFTLRYTVLSQRCLNVFYYEVDSANVSNSLADALEAFQAHFQLAFENIMAVGASFDQLDVDNVTDGLSFASLNLTWTPANSGQILSPFYCAGIRLNRASKATRNGYKRISGMTEGDIDDGVYTTGYLADLLVLALLIEDNISQTPNTDLVELLPVIAGFNPDGTLRTTNGISSAAPYGPTTQNSRKPDFSV